METKESITDFVKEMQTSKFTEDKFQGNFTDMKISSVGFGKGMYVTAQPNILRNDAVMEEIKRVTEAMETAIGHTIGPYADESMVQKTFAFDVPLFNTRDGVTILRNMKYPQPIPNAIYKILKETSEYLDKHIGDSTSSGIPIQNSLFNKIMEVFNDQTKGQWKYSPIGIKNICKICAKVIIDGITNNPLYQKTLPKLPESGVYDKETEESIIQWLTKIATVAANNDKETGAMVANLYRDKLDGIGDVIVMRAREGETEDSVMDSKAYITIPGLLDCDRMANNSDSTAWEAENPLIAIFDGYLEETDLPSFKKIVETAIFDLKRPLMVCAGQFNMNIAQYLRECIMGTYYNSLGQPMNDPASDKNAKPYRCCIAATKMRNKEVEEQNSLKDLVLMTGATMFSTELTKLPDYPDNREQRKRMLEPLFGTCEQISASYADVNYIGCKPNKAQFLKRIEDLKEKAERLKVLSKQHVTDVQVSDVEWRIKKLQSNTTYYYAGGETDSTKESRKLLVEDAVRAVGSTIRNGGFSIGSNMAVCHYINHNLEDIVEKVLAYINSININITAAENKDSLRNIVTVILEAIMYSFGSAYRYALYNMYRDEKTTMAKWKECIDSEKPIVYNIMTNKMEYFDSENIDNCTALVVPKETDSCLLKVTIENVGTLINIGNMITLYSPNLDVEALQIKQLETGAAYMASRM